MTEQQRPSDGIKEGLRTGIGILAAFKDAIEETIDDLLKQGDVSPDRAGEAVRSAMAKAQETLDEARDRFDWVSRKEFEALRAEVDTLRRKVADLEGQSDSVTIES
jgi:polyhydroxyalkanoate synthesis regulator phasin